jgi:hypothetical protein
LYLEEINADHMVAIPGQESDQKRDTLPSMGGAILDREQGSDGDAGEFGSAVEEG